MVESAELLFRSRGDVREGSFVSGGREDLLRADRATAAGSWPAARSLVDESVLRMQNLAVFL